MKGFKLRHGCLVMILILLFTSGLPAGGFGNNSGLVYAASSSVLDQEQSRWDGSVAVNSEQRLSQSFMPAISGKLDKVEINILAKFGSPGSLIIKIYEDGNMTTPLATAMQPNFGNNWVAVDFSGTALYLTREKSYRMVLSTENGGSSNGVNWYNSSENPYPRGVGINSNSDFSFRTHMIPDYSLSLSESEISSAHPSLTADGTSETTISVKLKDAQGTALTTGGAVVAITTTAGTVGQVTDHNDGTYTAQLTARTTTGDATVSATVGGSAMDSTANVQFVPGAPSTAKSTVEAAHTTLTADGSSQTKISVKLKDAQSNLLTTGGAAVAITTTAGTMGLVTDHNNGTYTAQLTARTTTGDATVSATIGGSAMDSTANVQFVPGAPSTAKSTVEAAHTTLTADGASQTTITVKLKDAQSNLLTTGGAAVAITTTAGTVGLVTDHNNGTYTAQLTAPTTTGDATVSATVGGSALVSTASVQYIPVGLSSSRSTVTASDLVVRADGTSKATIHVKLKDDYDHPLSGKRVLLQASGGQSVIQEVYGVTDVNGIAEFSVSNKAEETVMYSAQEEASGLALNETVSIRFTYDQPPNIKLQAAPVVPTFGSVTVTVTATIYGEFNSLSTIKWAAGSQSVSYFETQGEVITDTFTVQQNGIYSVYIADQVGNANVSLIDIQNIVPLSGNANLSGWQLTGLGGAVKFDFDPGTTNYTASVSHSVHGLKMKLTAADAHSVLDVNGQQVSGNSFEQNYSLVTGKNTFVVKVKAQDGSMKAYTLYVLRDEESYSEPIIQSVPIITPILPVSNSIAVRINGREVLGVATVRTDANGVKSIDVLLKSGALNKLLDPQAVGAEANLMVSVKEEAGKIVLRLSGDTIALLGDKRAAIILDTAFGQYRLPLAEVISRQSNWTNASEVQIAIELGDSELLSQLQDAAGQGGFRLLSKPIHFNVVVLGAGEDLEISSFDSYVQRVLYIPQDIAGTASTAVVWDEEQGIRPVPTEFIQVNGQQAAVIRSLTNSVYVLISKTPNLSDIQGHWAETVIEGMNGRLIVNGVDENRFAPEAAVTRAELAAFLARSLGLPETDQIVGFSDVSKSSWYNGVVSTVKAYGIMDGFDDGTFRPNQVVSRQEAIVTIVRSLRLAGIAPSEIKAGAQDRLSNYTDHNLVADWATDAIQIAIQEGLVKGYGEELRPQKSLTRAETAVLINKLLIHAGLINK